MKEIIYNSLGKFKVKIKTVNSHLTSDSPQIQELSINRKYIYTLIEKEFNKLSYEELADGWIQILPRKNTAKEIHHFNISLAELPHHLWKYLDIYTLFNIDNDNIITINDKIFKYSIQKSEHNILIYNLYMELKTIYTDNNKILELYNYCKKNNIRGWLMIKAKKLLSS